MADTKTQYSVLAVQHIDAVAKSNPNRLLCMVPKTKDPRDGFYNITFQNFSQAVDHMAWYLDSHLGERDSFNVFGFLSHPTDFRYQVLVVAAMKIRWIAFFTSPRNSMVAHLSLIDEAKCRTWLVDEKVPPAVTEMANQRSLNLVSIPSEKFYLTADFTEEAPPHFPYNKTFEEGRDDIFAIWHSSGSTGIPKVIHIRHSLLCAANFLRAFPESNFQYNHFRGLKLFITLPWFHAAAYYLTFGSGIYYNSVAVLGPATPLTAELVDLYHQFADVDVTIAAPSILQDIANNELYAKNCTRLKYIGNGGGPSSAEVGEVLAKYTHPFNIGGATETGLWLTDMLDPEDFMYWKYEPLCGFDLRPLDDQHSELWMIRDPTLRDFQPIFDTFPKLQEWPTKDVYTKHPMKPDLWKLVGRTDDVIVLSTGEKVNSVTIESSICQHPHVTGAVAFGEGRFELGLVLEVQPENAKTVRSTIEPLLTQINRNSVAHGRISENMIVLSSPDRPFPRAGKGTVQKKMCLELYKKEIDKVYNNNAESEADQTELSSTGGYENVITFLETWISKETEQSAPRKDQDIFESGSGIDSLLVVRLARTLDKASPNVKVLPQNIYANPTISKLAAFIAEHSSEGVVEQLSREQQMDIVLEKLSRHLPLNTRPPMPIQYRSLTVAVTGTTGSLGSYLLQSLLNRRPQIDKIYCLNRKSKDEIMKSNQISPADLQDIEFLQIDVSRPRLGLSQDLYKDLAQNIDIFIHNAWDVNFNKSLDSFESHMYGLEQIIGLCVSSLKSAPLHFTSTISTVSKWRPNMKHQTNGHSVASNGNGASSELRSKVPEEIHEDWEVSLSMGYAESKHISDRLLAQAAEECDISISIYRVGQIAGPVKRSGRSKEKEMWQKHEWVPTLIQTSLALGALPSDLGPMTEIDWVPIDILSDVLVELALNSTISAQNGAVKAVSAVDRNLNVYHPVNPQTTTWSELLPTILANSASNTAPRIVSLPEWVDLVSKASTSDDVQVQDLPALKMLPFFRNLSQSSIGDGIRLDTRKTCATSETLSTLEAVKPEWMELWMQQWKF